MRALEEVGNSMIKVFTVLYLRSRFHVEKRHDGTRLGIKNPCANQNPLPASLIFILRRRLIVSASRSLSFWFLQIPLSVCILLFEFPVNVGDWAVFYCRTIAPKSFTQRRINLRYIHGSLGRPDANVLCTKPKLAATSYLTTWPHTE